MNERTNINKKKRKSACLGEQQPFDDTCAQGRSANFTVYPDPQTGLIDKNKFLSTFSAYKVIYLPQILNGCSSRTTSTSTGGEHDINDNDESKTEKDATADINTDDSAADACADGDGTRSTKVPPFTWRDVYKTYASLKEKDKSSWTAEKYENIKTVVNQSEGQEQTFNSAQQDLEPDAFLRPTEEVINGSKESSSITSSSSSSSSSNVPRGERGYSSFIVQHDKEALDRLLHSLPLTQLPVTKYDSQNNENETKGECASEGTDPKRIIDAGAEAGAGAGAGAITITEQMKMKHGPCIWLFYGRNNRQEPLDGRPEHTDSISHDGTWHYQLSGLKEWRLRPTEELIKEMQTNPLIGEEEMAFWKNEVSDCINKGIGASNETETNTEVISHPSQRRGVTISCREGDVLLVNTRLWWHSTKIPQQPKDDNKDGHVPSVSYARDLYLTWDENDGDNGDDEIVDDGGNMTNLDGLYASNDIEAGTIIFTEEDMPDCELHRTTDNPNCEVIEMENGSGAIVSCRKITAGEFFCVLETDGEDNEEYESDDEFEEDIESE